MNTDREEGNAQKAIPEDELTDLMAIDYARRPDEVGLFERVWNWLYCLLDPPKTKGGQ